MAENSKEDTEAYPKSSRTIDACPHCGRKLSPWQQVLLATDRALVCRICWYRIILEIAEDEPNPNASTHKE